MREEGANDPLIEAIFKAANGVVDHLIVMLSLQIIGGDPDHAAEKKRNIAWRDVECLAYSFKGIAMIDNLNGLHNLTKLQLDNNAIAKVENITHRVRMEGRRGGHRMGKEAYQGV